MRKNKSKVIKKPKASLIISKTAIITILVFFALNVFLMDKIVDIITRAETEAYYNLQELEWATTAYYNYPTAKNEEEYKDAVNHLMVSRTSVLMTVDGQTYLDTYNKIIVIYNDRDTNKNKDERYHVSILDWDKGKIDVYREISDYINNKSNIFHEYYIHVDSVYYDSTNDIVYPGKVLLKTYSNFKFEEEIIKEYDLSPSDKTNLTYITEGYFYGELGIEAPTDKPSSYSFNIALYDQAENEVSIIYDNNEAKCYTLTLFTIVCSANVLAIVILTITIGLICYYRSKSVYEVFLYRQQTINAMAHDLKTPLAIASLYVANLKENLGNPDKCEQHANEIESSINYMNTLVSDILEFSNSETDSRSLEVEDIDIAADINSHLKSIDANIKARNLTISVNGSSIRKTDRYLWDQAINNLIDNAVKYCVTDSEITITISDSSIEISNKTEADIPNVNDLKEPFVKGDDNRGENSGSGLGLSIADNNLTRLGYKLTISCADKTFTAKVTK